VHTLLTSYQVNVVCLQETKMADISHGIILSFWALILPVGWCCLPLAQVVGS
jgi:hypothetical protein